MASPEGEDIPAHTENEVWDGIFIVF